MVRSVKRRQRNAVLIYLVFSVALMSFPLSGYAQDAGTSYYNWNNGKFYISDIDNYSWTDWQGYATSLYGGKLASSTSSTENQWIQLTIRNLNGTVRFPEGEAWIGLTDLLSEGNWVWIDGSGYSYTNWDTGEPNDGDLHTTEDFVLFRWYSNGKWNDYTNAAEFGALIECPIFAPNNSVCDQLNDGGAPVCNTTGLLLQNATFSTSQTFKTEGLIEAGTTVDGGSPQGDFEITGGNTIMWSETYVRLAPGFSVHSGGTLEARATSTICN